MSPSPAFTFKALARRPTVTAPDTLSGRASVSAGPPASCTRPAAAVPASRFIGGSLKARATRSDCGAWNTSAVGPYCSSSPASITAV
ncbi:hypothetical protein D9M72_166040 [compost metagenome]